MKRELHTAFFNSGYGSFIDYLEFIDENPYIEIVSVINNDACVIVTYYEKQEESE